MFPSETQAPVQQRAELPRLPAPLALPARLVPGWVQRGMATRILNQVFAEPLADGWLDFLRGRCVRIRVEDLDIEIGLTLQNGRIAATPPERPADVSIEGRLYAFILLLAQQDDPDTLFFNRQLRFVGDTELGLEVKNFLAAFEPDARAREAVQYLYRFARWASGVIPS